VPLSSCMGRDHGDLRENLAGTLLIICFALTHASLTHSFRCSVPATMPIEHVFAPVPGLWRVAHGPLPVSRGLWPVAYGPWPRAGGP
jgi:hypothetical protein